MLLRVLLMVGIVLLGAAASATPVTWRAEGEITEGPERWRSEAFVLEVDFHPELVPAEPFPTGYVAFRPGGIRLTISGEPWEDPFYLRAAATPESGDLPRTLSLGTWFSAPGDGQRLYAALVLAGEAAVSGALPPKLEELEEAWVVLTGAGAGPLDGLLSDRVATRIWNTSAFGTHHGPGEPVLAGRVRQLGAVQVPEPSVALLLAPGLASALSRRRVR